MDIHIANTTTTGVVSLGQARDVLRKSLGPWRSFRRTASSSESDHFEDSGVIATYSASGTVELLEFVEPARVDVAGVPLIGEHLSGVCDALEQRNIDVAVDDQGAWVPAFSLGLYAPTGVVEGAQLGSDIAPDIGATVEHYSPPTFASVPGHVITDELVAKFRDI